MGRRIFFPIGLHTLPLIILFLLIPLPWERILSSDSIDDTCRNCHAGEKAKELGLVDIYSRIETFRYPHQPVEDKCAFCHIKRGFRRDRKWEITTTEGYKEFVFSLVGLSGNRKYSMELRLNDIYGNEASPVRVQFTPTEVDLSVKNDNKGPVIRNVKTEEIRQAIFLEAVIGWSTDEPSSAVVEYGTTEKYGERVSKEEVFSKRHRIRLTGLKAGQTYHYRITSRDIFGNTSVSEDFIIDTSEPVRASRRTRIIDRIPPEIREVNLFKVNGTDDVYLLVRADEPVKAHLTIHEPSEMDYHGFGFLPTRVSTINVCIKCHPQGISHPVGIRSRKAGIRVPPNLPTIEGGMLTCVTCHNPHGGNRRYFTRLESAKELCVACHKEGPF